MKMAGSELACSPVVSPPIFRASQSRRPTEPNRARARLGEPKTPRRADQSRHAASRSQFPRARPKPIPAPRRSQSLADRTRRVLRDREPGGPAPSEPSCPQRLDFVRLREIFLCLGGRPGATNGLPTSAVGALACPGGRPPVAPNLRAADSKENGSRAPDRTRAIAPVRPRDSAPNEANSRRRPNPSPPPGGSGRPPYVRRRAVLCGTGRGARPRAADTELSKTTRYHRNSGPARSPNPRPGPPPSGTGCPAGPI